ncbi:MAG: hypothetical protein JWO90_2312 [Solirubrobacterales bacterium]|jgi:hypothetical protein|nr:hypothetical protein [Solirubrobacterales bacterium]
MLRPSLHNGPLAGPREIARARTVPRRAARRPAPLQQPLPIPAFFAAARTLRSVAAMRSMKPA